MNDEQGILRRLDHYADCIEKGVHVTGTQLKSLVKDIRESGLVLSQSPPAEAKPVACDEDRFEQFLQAAIARSQEPLRELGEYLAGVLDDDQWPAADRLLLQLATATPSAPVGVEGVRREIQNALRELDAVMTAEDNTSDAVGCAELALQRALEALAQQPAAVDGDWRKKAAEWLEAKAVEQEAANQKWPSHAACYKEWRDRPGILRHLAIQVLAAQPGGSDNDR